MNSVSDMSNPLIAGCVGGNPFCQVLVVEAVNSPSANFTNSATAPHTNLLQQVSVYQTVNSFTGVYQRVNSFRGAAAGSSRPHPTE